MTTDLEIILPDRRRLSYAEFGDPDGLPVLYFHGAPSSRFEPLLVGDAEWSRLGLRVIAPDRPGMGRSDFQSQRGFSQWPPDVVALADALGLGRFAVLGNSGGGGYTAVCAVRIPERLTAAVIVSGGWRMDLPEARQGMPLPNRLAMTCARRAPWLLGLMLKAMAATTGGDRNQELASMKKRVPAADYAAFAEPGRIEALGQLLRESLVQGPRGPVWDMGMYVREFDFRPGENRFPITLFHGEQDANAPIALARRMAAELPHARLITSVGDAHLSMLCNHSAAIAQALRGGSK